MVSAFKVKPTDKAVKSYYAALATYADQSVEHEGAVRSAFQNLLSETGRKVGWTLIPELSLDPNGHEIRPDGTFRDEFTIERGYWEAKDTDDDLEAQINKKIKRGYRLTNTSFEVPTVCLQDHDRIDSRTIAGAILNYAGPGPAGTAQAKACASIDGNPTR